MDPFIEELQTSAAADSLNGQSAETNKSSNRVARIRVSGPGEEGEDDQYNIKGRIPPQKTVSFKGERKTTGRMFLRQLSSQMSDTDHAGDGDIETAIAAAAYAIAYEKEEGSPEHKRPNKGWRTPTKTKSKRVDIMNEATNTSNITKQTDVASVIKPPDADGMSKQTDMSKISRWVTGKETKAYGGSTGQKTSRASKSLDKLMWEDSNNNGEMPEKAMEATPTIKKTPTFSDKYLNDTGNITFEGRQGMKAEAKWYIGTDAMKSRKEETKADVWEEEQIAKIRKWYKKMNSRILQWEGNKKMKARRRLERKERELEEMRARYLQEYRNEISRIDKITGGAKAATEERKRNKELKATAKAAQIRLKGKAPRHKCFCF